MHIAINHSSTKKDFKAGVFQNPAKVILVDTSITQPSSGGLLEVLDGFTKSGKILTVTNTNRSWFAEVKLNKAGCIVIV